VLVVAAWAAAWEAHPAAVSVEDLALQAVVDSVEVSAVDPVLWVAALRSSSPT
jgi:hypothetical protein